MLGFKVSDTSFFLSSGVHERELLDRCLVTWQNIISQETQF